MSSDHEVRTRRREFIGALAGGGLALSACERRPATPSFDEIADVIVVGAGAAGLSCACTAKSSGATVIVLEKGPVAGGTTSKSGGFYWIFNNAFMRAKGIADPKPAALRFMAALAAPHRYDPASPTLGLTAREHSCIEAYFDHGSKAIEHLERIGALKSKWWPRILDYFAHHPDNKAPRGRSLTPSSRTQPRPPLGHELVRQLQAYLLGKGVKIRTRHRASALIRDDKGRVTGLEVAARGGKSLRLGARKGVVFASGGFPHDVSLCEAYLEGPIFGSCAVPSCEGDFMRIAATANASMGNVKNAWWSQVVLEEALAMRSVANNLAFLRNDMILVDRTGKRVVNESSFYHERTQVHFRQDPRTGGYSELLLFLVWSSHGKKKADFHGDEYALNVKTVAALREQLSARLAKVARRTGGFTLDASFEAGLAQTIERYNGFAKTGKDEDFRRGETPCERAIALQMGGASARAAKNPALRALDLEGGLFAMIVAPGVLDSKGGPAVNANAQLLDLAEKPIIGLYGAGNCVASPALGGYPAGGITIGPALTFGYLAAKHASAQKARDIGEVRARQARKA
ncbi:MAG: FAD-dependent oxidoreductase [Myxococcales bacterium]|nr:FAD-dependent oxidoreductase [Myxococcales bacterium]